MAHAKQTVIERVTEALRGLFVVTPTEQALMRESYGVNIDDDEDQWRRLTEDYDRDLQPVTQDRMQKLASKLWESNLLANRLVELVVAYLIAEGVRLTVKDKENQRILDKFWRDPINAMDEKLPMYIRELELYGEQCYPTFVNEATGEVRLGYLDPCLINEIVMDPDNPSQPIGVITKRDRKGKYYKYRVIINGGEDCFTNRTQQIRAQDFADGECFLLQINKLASGRRGRSSLLPQADWIDAYDEFMFGELDRAKFMRAFFWNVTLKNATPEQVKKRAQEISAPEPGAIRVHNDSEEWTAEAPSLQAGDSAEHARLFRNHILGGATIPEHWYGGGGDVNRASASEMGEPTFKVLSGKQGTWKGFLEKLGRYALRKKPGAGEPEFDDERFNCTAEFPELTATDTTAWATALQQVAASMVIAIGQDLVTEVTAVRLLGAIASRLGVEFDAEKELAAARGEAAKRRENDNFVGDPGSDEPGGDGSADPAVAASPNL